MMNIFDIQHSSYHDGPGMRTVVFLKGCSLECFWCQNPESQNSRPQLMVYPDLCIGCRKCEHVCMESCHSFIDGSHIYQRNKCTGCGNCAENCYAGALVLSGSQIEEEDVLMEILKDLEFYQISGGGVTLSGGEPLLQADACAALLKYLRQEGIHTLIETAGLVSWEAFEKILPFTDHFFYDVKLINPEKHKEFCGAPNEQILNNLVRLSEKTEKITVRMPIIPGVNDKEADMKELADFIQRKTRVREIRLIPFHRLGKGKYDALEMKYKAASLESPSVSRIKELSTAVNTCCGARKINCQAV